MKKWKDCRHVFLIVCIAVSLLYFKNPLLIIGSVFSVCFYCHNRETFNCKFAEKHLFYKCFFLFIFCIENILIDKRTIEFIKLSKIEAGNVEKIKGYIEQFSLIFTVGEYAIIILAVMGAFCILSSTFDALSELLLKITSMLAYNLFNWFRRLVLPAKLRKLQIDTIRLKLFKIAAKLIHSARYLKFKLCSSCPYQEQFIKTLINIKNLDPKLE